MELHFNIEYGTVLGEELVLNVVPSGEAKAPAQAHRMATDDGLHWHCFLTDPEAFATGVAEYFYSVTNHGRETRHEWAPMRHRLELTVPQAQRYEVHDRWTDIPQDAWRYSVAFANGQLQQPRHPEGAREVLRLSVRAPQLRRGERLVLTGSIPELGQWDPAKALPMQQHAQHEWVVLLDASALDGREVEMKFVALGHGQPLWETGPNRRLSIPTAQPRTVVSTELAEARFDIPQERLAGTLVPVFSLRTKGSFGVGDFGDLQAMASYAARTGQRVLQVLPINDTTASHTWADSYPYSCTSVFALHPQYVDFRQLPPLADPKAKRRFERLRRELNALPQIDYERVNQAKHQLLRLLYDQEGKRTLASADFARFFDEAQQWLVPYAFFSHLRDTHQLNLHPHWHERHREALSNPRTRIYRDVAYHYFVQYILDRQMQAAHQHAQSLGVLLKGDIPIGVSRTGCDAWVEPQYFNMDGQAGAPPDDFAADGQNWGFPTYNWDAMLRDGCQWWVRRFQHMARYFDAYRIDHVLGFVRIWEIPMPHPSGLMGQFAPALGLTTEEINARGVFQHTDRLFLTDHRQPNLRHPRIDALRTDAYQQLPQPEKDAFSALYEDYFYHRNNSFWYAEAMKKLPRLTEATRMLVCAEDLGMVPSCVAPAMEELRILTLEIQSMPKQPGLRFAHLEQNPYPSVCTISTHDMPTLRQWWDEDHERAQDYFATILRRPGTAPHPLPAALARDIVNLHLQSPSMLCIVSLQDWLATSERLRHPDPDAERINIPANPRHYWRYRMHLNIEDLAADKAFTADLAQLIAAAQRQPQPIHQTPQAPNTDRP